MASLKCAAELLRSSTQEAPRRSEQIDTLFRGSALPATSSLELGWQGFTLERRRVAAGERAEEVIGDHFLVLWQGQPALGERADRGGRFAPYAKYPGMLSIGPAGILPAVRARNEAHVVACALEPRFAEHVELELDARLNAPLHEQIGFEDRGLQHLLLLMLAELEAGGLHGRLYAESLVQSLTIRFLHLARADHSPRVARVNALPRGKLSRIIERMHAGLRDELSLDALAAESGYSRAHFLRMFRAATGKPPHQYLLELRLEHARRQLDEHPGASLAQVALASGFSSHAHLTTLFRRHFGVTPSQYRRSK
jgi:AraC family transcriptional regulator